MSDENETEPKPANDTPPQTREGELEAELKKVKDQLLRAVADAENARRRPYSASATARRS